MGRSPCCDADAKMKKGPWTPEEDQKLMEYIKKNGCGNWRNLPKFAGLNRCGKSCRLRWTNYLRPDIKRGRFSEEEEHLVVHLHSVLGNKWSAIAAKLPGRTDNEIKNHWNTHLRKKLLMNGIDPVTHRPRIDHLNLISTFPNLIATNPLIHGALQLQKLQLLQNLIHAIANTGAINAAAAAAAQNINDHGSLGLHDYCMPSNTISSDGNDLVAPVNHDSCSTERDSSQSFDSVPFDSTHSFVAANLSVDSSPSSKPFDSTQQLVAANNYLSAESSPNSTPFEPLGGLTLDDIDGDLGWQDILDQISW